MKVFYTEKQVVDQGKQSFGGIKSPSAMKPKQIAMALRTNSNMFSHIEFVEPNPVTIDDLKLCHNSEYINKVMGLEVENGFGCISKDVNDSLLYTSGAMIDAARTATPTMPTCALVSGFHHAGYNGWRGLGYFCTFNGLLITAMKLLNEGRSKIAIIDCDMHWGNGTDDILKNMPQLNKHILHITLGKEYINPEHAQAYLEAMRLDGHVGEEIWSFMPDVILYQAGADVHVDDPYGGVLTTQQILQRDLLMFEMAKQYKIPLAWNLAGGYQIDVNGSIDKVIDLHLNTFRACEMVYGSF